MSKDIMLDLETLGTSPGCVILSIGASSFCGTYTFYEKISIESSKLSGLVEEPDTMRWWAKQSVEARNESFSGTSPLMGVLGRFSDFYSSIPTKPNEKKFIWGNGADFDLPILAAAYKAANMERPWEPFNGRCYRTLKNLYYEVKAPVFEGTKHTALADAQHQARHALMILRKHFSTDKD